jgi:hypothetical protein
MLERLEEPMQTRSVIQLSVVAATLVAAVACRSVTTGNEGNFRFSYVADERIFDFNKPIAVGASLDMDVTSSGDDSPIELESVESSDTAVMEAELNGGNSLTVTATGDGNVLISVKGTGPEGEATDSINLNARVPEVHKLGHTCQNFNGIDATEYAYLVDQPVYVPFEFEMSNGQPVIGYGYYPISIDAGAMLDESHQGSQYMRLDLDALGLTTITSDIDGTTLQLNVIEHGDIDGVLQPFAFVLEDIDVGDVNPFYVLPSAGGRPVCQADTVIEVASITPDICDVRLANSLAGDTSDQGKEFGWFEVEGIAAGLCEYTVTYPNENGGAGATETFAYDIEP